MALLHVQVSTYFLLYCLMVVVPYLSRFPFSSSVMSFFLHLISSSMKEKKKRKEKSLPLFFFNSPKPLIS